MLLRVGIICFAGSYLVALILEVTRLVFRSRLPGAVMLAFAAAGLLAHTIYLGHRAVIAAGAPLSSEQDWCLVAAWLLMAIYLYLLWRRPQALFGLFFLPLALGLIGAAAWWASPEPFAREPASRVWGMIHGSAIVLATVAVFVGFAAGLMYLWQVARLKRKLPPGGPRLPSLEWLERVNRRSIGAALPLLAIGVLAGGVLNMIRRDESGGRLPWYDPVVLTTLALLVWLVVAAIIGGVYRKIRTGRHVAYVTLVGFVFLVFSLIAMLLLPTQHAGKYEKAVRSQESGVSSQEPEARSQEPEAGDVQFAICNLQFAICNAVFVKPKASSLIGGSA